MRKTALVLGAGLMAFVLAGGPHAQTSRNTTAARDVRVLARTLEERHPSLFRHVSRERFRAEVDRLASAAPSLSPNELLVGLMRIAVVRGTPRDLRLAVEPDVRVDVTSFLAGADPVLSRALAGL